MIKTLATPLSFILKPCISLFLCINTSSADVIALLDSGSDTDGSSATLVDISTAGDVFTGAANFSSSVSASTAGSELNTGFSDHQTNIPSRVYNNDRLTFDADTAASAHWEFSQLNPGEEWEVLVYQQEITQMSNATNLQASVQGEVVKTIDQRYTKSADFIAEFEDNHGSRVVTFHPGYRSLGNFRADASGNLKVSLSIPTDANGIMVADSVVIRKKTDSISEYHDDVLILMPTLYNTPYISPATTTNFAKILEELNGLYSESASHSTTQATILNPQKISTTGLTRTNLNQFFNPDTKNEYLYYLQRGYENVVIFDNLTIMKERPGAIFEFMRQFSEVALAKGTTPYLAVNGGNVEDLEVLAENVERIVNGTGIQMMPVGQILDSQGLYVSNRLSNNGTNRYNYTIANTLFSSLSGESAAGNAHTSSYVSDNEVAAVASAVDAYLSADHDNVEAYTDSYAEQGSYVYRTIDPAQAPFNGDIPYFRKGTSTEFFMNDALMRLIPANGFTFTSVSLGTNEGTNRNVLLENLDDNATALSGPGMFLYSRGTTVTGAIADTYTSEDVLNYNFSYSFSWWWFNMNEAYVGTPRSAEILLQNAGGIWDTSNTDITDWKYLPFHLALTRVYDDNRQFIGTDDREHQSVDMQNFSSGMLLTSALGKDIDPDNTIMASDSALRAFTIATQAMKDFAHLSETGEHIPDTNIQITTESLPIITPGVAYSVQLNASNGVGDYQWEVHTGAQLPTGMKLSRDGTLYGIVYQSQDPQVTVFKVTDTDGGFRKVALELNFALSGYEAYVSNSANAVSLLSNAFDDDADLDTIANGLEFYLGTDLNIGDSPALTATDGEPLTFTHPVNGDAQNFVTPVYEWSTDLIHFYADGDSDGSTQVDFVVTDNGTHQAVTTQVTSSLVEMPKLFSRLKVYDNNALLADQSLPIEFDSLNIGNVGVQATFTENQDSFSVRGSGADIWSTADGFHFAAQDHSQDGTLTAKVESITETNRWAKAGVMFRASADANAANVFVCMRPDNQLIMQVRSTAGGTTANVADGILGLTGQPKYTRISRSGNDFTGYYSEDGENWITIATVTIDMPEDILAGLAVTSHANTVLATAEFTEVNFSGIAE